MTSFTSTREQIGQNIHNEDLKMSALVLTDVIERMSNVYSNSLPSGIKSFDVHEISDMIDSAKKIALKRVV
jgi:hypothetical protein